MRAFRRVNQSGIGSVIVDSVNDEEAAAATADGAYTVRTDLGEFGRTHNYRSASGAERIQATVNRFDRYYTHDVVVAVPDDMEDLQPFYMQGLMYALASSEVGIATLVSPLKNGEIEDYGVVKASVDWNSDRVVHPLEGSRVGTLRDIKRDAAALGTDDVYKFVPIHAWRRGALDRLVNMPPSERELDEGTDLVRALEHRGVEAAERRLGAGHEAPQLGEARGIAARVGDDEPVAARGQVARGRDAGAPEADDHAAGTAGGLPHQRSFSVASPSRTSMKEMIQKRTMTFGSAQPFSS